MTTAPPVKKKENTFVKAMGDLVILGLLLVGAGFGGYFWGTHQQLAPVLKVPPGTAGAIIPPKSESAAAAVPASAEPPAHKKHKYWLYSSGSDYIGYSITAEVNGTGVDSFFGPGKMVDVTQLVNKGKNTINFDAKALGEKYNKHEGDASSILTLQLVSGSSITDNFKSSDVVLSYKRNATDSGDSNESFNFTGE